MEEAGRVVEYFRSYPIAALIIAIASGFAATVTVERGRRRSWLFFFVVGVLGFFVGQYVLVYLRWKDILENLPQFRYLFDFFTAYVGSFVVAATIHFIKPL